MKGISRKGKKFFFFEMVTIGLAAAVYPSANTVTIKVRPAALHIITNEKSLGLGIPMKIATKMLPVPVSLTVGKNHRAESVTSSE